MELAILFSNDNMQKVITIKKTKKKHQQNTHINPMKQPPPPKQKVACIKLMKFYKSSTALDLGPQQFYQLYIHHSLTPWPQ